MSTTEYLWHYTSLDGLKGILKEQHIRATDYRYTNDSSELITAQTILKIFLAPELQKEILAKQLTRDSRNKAIIESEGGLEEFCKKEAQRVIDSLYGAADKLYTEYLACFSEHPENDEGMQEDGLLSQWKGYGIDGGFAIVFDKEKLRELFYKNEAEFELDLLASETCLYGNQKNIPPEIEELLPFVAKYALRIFRGQVGYAEPQDQQAPDKEINAFIRCMAFLKHKAFHEEHEFRFFIARHKNSNTEKVDKKVKKIHLRKGFETDIPYINIFEGNTELPIVKIVIGPHRNQGLNETKLNSFLTDNGLSIDVSKSSIPYRGQSLPFKRNRLLSAFPRCQF